MLHGSDGGGSGGDGGDDEFRKELDADE